MSQVGGIQYGSALFDGGGRETVVNHGRGKQAESGMAVLVVVPGEELLRKNPRILQTPKTFREAGPVFQGPEVALRIRIVIGDMRTAVGFGDAQVRHQEGYRL